MFTITVTQLQGGGGAKTELSADLNLVDLAGSERASDMQYSKAQRKRSAELSFPGVPLTDSMPGGPESPSSQ